MYKVAKASEYLVITGLGISDIKLAKKSWVFPGQSCTVLDLSPVNYTFNKVQAMSAEKLIFQLIAAFTIGPKVDDKQSLLKYAKIFSSPKKLSDLVQGIVEGETRVLAASMAMEEIFRGTKEFKQQVFEKVQLELNQFGLLIYNANVKQLFDVSGHQYLNYLGKKTQTEAANQAKVDEAEAKMKGDMEEKLIEGKTKQYAAMIDAERKVFENKKEAEVEEANSELAKKKATLAQAAQVAEVEAGKAVALREAELQREVEKIYTLTTTEKRKTELLSKASLDYETKVQEANWELYKKQKAAEAALFEKEKEAEAKRALAEAELFAKEEEAKGLVALGQAQGAYLKALLDAMGGNYADVKDFLMLNRGLPNGNAPQLQMANTNCPIALTPQLQNANAALLQSQMINVQSAQMANRDALLRSQIARINNINNNNTNLNGLPRLQPSNNGNNGVEANKAVAAVPSPTQIGTLQPNKSS